MWIDHPVWDNHPTFQAKLREKKKSVIILYASSRKVTNFMAYNSHFKTNEQLPDLLRAVQCFTVSVVYTVRVQN